MAAKKGAEVEVKKFLGRPGNHLKMGIVGLPNVGKSSLFNVLTNMSIPAENFPFCTIDPNESRCAVPDPRFDELCKAFRPASEVPAYLKITDIAGLVRNAHQGEGLGNAFLSHIKAVDGIFQMVRIFDNEEIIHVEGDIDPIRDLDIIAEELRLKDIEIVEGAIGALEKVVQRIDKTKKAELEFLQSLLEFVKAGKDVRTGEWKAQEIEWINPLFLLTAKPVVYLLNLTENDYKRRKNKWLGKVKAWVDEHSAGSPMIPVCVPLEAEASMLPVADRPAFWESKKLQSSIPKIIRTGYHNLRLVHFFTCGTDEVRCWTIREGDKAPEAAGTIHSDFQRGFICAEAYSYDDFVQCGKTEGAVRAAGKIKQQGKNYVVQDGDILFIKANTGVDQIIIFATNSRLKKFSSCR